MRMNVFASPRVLCLLSFPLSEKNFCLKEALSTESAAISLFYISREDIISRDICTQIWQKNDFVPSLRK